MTAVTAAPYALACTLLVAAGVLKLRTRPLLSAGEIVLGAAALVVHALAPVVALAYAAFVVVTVRAIQAQRACGCFGPADDDARPPSTGHAAADAALAASALIAAAGHQAPIAFAGFTYAVLLATSTYLAMAVLA